MNECLVWCAVCARRGLWRPDHGVVVHRARTCVVALPVSRLTAFGPGQRRRPRQVAA